ncbi:NUDIX domain-containing protein [Spirillospora sp. NPDC048819]|uniref:NUDIX domain-containing protein n=1 Tax=Spirillospora sp. NPDC048819 TaxID=3155268 RepID=UPI0033C43731
MTAREYVSLIADTHMLLTRPDGCVLLLVRANTGYMDGHASLPAGHVEVGESADTAAIRETKEEVGVLVDSADLAFAHVMHRHTPGERGARVSFFFSSRRWMGEVINAEPRKSSGLIWADPADLAGSTGGVPVVEYVSSALATIRAAERFSAYGW